MAMIEWETLNSGDTPVVYCVVWQHILPPHDRVGDVE